MAEQPDVAAVVPRADGQGAVLDHPKAIMLRDAHHIRHGARNAAKMDHRQGPGARGYGFFEAVQVHVA